MSTATFLLFIFRISYESEVINELNILDNVIKTENAHRIENDNKILDAIHQYVNSVFTPLLTQSNQNK